MTPERFKSTEYVLVDFRWCKDLTKAHSMKTNFGKAPADSATLLLKKVESIQERLMTDSRKRDDLSMGNCWKNQSNHQGFKNRHRGIEACSRQPESRINLDCE